MTTIGVQLSRSVINTLRDIRGDGSFFNEDLRMAEDNKQRNMLHQMLKFEKN